MRAHGVAGFLASNPVDWREEGIVSLVVRRCIDF
ncbi:hypothetical protein DF3PB_30036 [uncultured Defluviicoccus sp.]|uniref:Uncharacterized protein n=1 Tax=metagenome TaxID=256318 RepID=A0A380TFV9_9ZZZZ|nr:hypothetical protein DF3PB_30036 [uncultured Defluviicoccus sp.]